MIADFTVETFEHQCHIEQWPPEIREIETLLQEALPSGSQVLQWAIVKSDVTTRILWLEGSYCKPRTAPV